MEYATIATATPTTISAMPDPQPDAVAARRGIADLHVRDLLLELLDPFLALDHAPSPVMPPR